MTPVVTPLRVVTKVRSNQMSKVLQGVTHPTELGASRLAFRMRDKGPLVPPEVALLLDLLREEHGAELRIPNLDLSEHLERPLKPSIVKGSSLAGVVPEDFIPPPPPAVVCEFDLMLRESKHPAGGRQVMAVFGFLVFQIEGEVKIACEGGYDGPETGEDTEASGVWRAANRRERDATTERVPGSAKRRATG